ncbi:hypothetical protein [Pantoea sp. BAV 3049]|uniref:hypothetical protein n=1 Tax=Pantoea sp. BAV 3049 TaxID=2654188 RepID=UPI00131D5CE9|nr:hypothetical protein [Pantoea sp. BAV 3049]
MVKSEVYYNRVICIDTLLSLNGVIPSLAEFQLKLVNLIDQFSKELISEGQCEQLSDDLCHIICSYLDKHIALRLHSSNISWERNLLSRHFYGYDIEFGSLADRIGQLLENSDGKIFNYAYRLLPLILKSLGEDKNIAALILRYAPEPVAEVLPESEEDKAEEILLFTPAKSRSCWANPAIWQTGIMLILLLLLWIYCSKYLDGLY